ncbi:amidohydrolase [Solicola gregarius]|uniref:Amidohydrolase n=1 Tax=Solicola gregarius TaxID=2908642 RepID=A0AA46TEM7_9ACTN|nr:amidohydrolase [Solicola gregarius]UYM03954.1 amidohydrolase [Solicola gregarius]
MPTPDAIAKAVDDLSDELRDLRRDLHAHPELAWHEERTTDAVVSMLEKGGVAYERLNGSGVVAEVGSPGRPIVALRGDMDGLPLEDTTTDPWRSRTPGVAHACGHDVHTSALVGAALALSSVHAESPLPVRARLLFQPAEEIMPGGAHKVIDADALEGVDRIFAVHCDPSVDVGQVGLRDGAITGACDSIRVRLSGRGGHTSRPHLTQDLTYALAALLTQLPAALSRRLDPRAGASMVWGVIQAGNALNVIPSSGEIAGTLRMLDAAAWHEAEHLVRTLIRDLIAPYGVSADVTYVRGVPPVVNDTACTSALRRAVESTLGAGAVAAAGQSLGGEDFAWYLERVPGAMGRLGTRTPGGPTYDLHQGSLRVDERAVDIGAKLLATVAVDTA